MIAFYRLIPMQFHPNGHIDENSMVEYEKIICKDIFYDYAASLKPAVKAWAEREAIKKSTGNGKPAKRRSL
jgi:hypothetical protein